MDISIMYFFGAEFPPIRNIIKADIDLEEVDNICDSILKPTCKNNGLSLLHEIRNICICKKINDQIYIFRLQKYVFLH